MNRSDEFWALMQELEETPAALNGTAQRAKARAARSRIAKFCGIPLGSLAGAAAAFILAVNTIPTFASACADIPILGELAAAVDFSPSLSAAVENQYVQIIDQTQTDGDRSLTLDYAIIDEHQIAIFYSTDRTYEIFPELTCADGEKPGYGYGLHFNENNELNVMTFSFISGEKAPTSFTLELRILPSDDLSQPSSSFSFDISLDPDRVAKAELMEVGQWVELEDGRIFLDYLEIYPTRTILHFDEDPENTAWLTGLKFWFEDDKGNRYEKKDGPLTASGTSGESESILTYYFQSLYYYEIDHLTLSIGAAEWRSKNAQPVEVDLINMTATNLPEYITFSDETEKFSKEEWFYFEGGPEREGFSQIFKTHAYAPDGTQYDYDDYSQGFRIVNDENGNLELIQEIIILKNYPYDAITLIPRYTHMTLLEDPILVAIK